MAELLSRPPFAEVQAQYRRASRNVDHDLTPVTSSLGPSDTQAVSRPWPKVAKLAAQCDVSSAQVALA